MSATNSSWFYAAKMFVTFEVITAAVFAAAAAASASASASAATVLLGCDDKLGSVSGRTTD
jgi:hypothetical protein